MKAIKISALTISFAISALSLFACAPQDKTTTDKDQVQTGKGFAVLELFTSEGCSSCPPADALLAKIQEESEGKDVYLLAYHVDYWDRLGWKDIFSNAEYSERQNQYGMWMNSSQIYTPQLIINGKSEYVGSDGRNIRNMISQQLDVKPEAKLALQLHQDGTQFKVQYQSEGVQKKSNLLIAVVEKIAHSKVTRGENEGRELTHVQIVHKLQVQALSTTQQGSIVVALPEHFDAQNWEILGLVQDQKNGRITAATKAGFTADVVKQ